MSLKKAAEILGYDLKDEADFNADSFKEYVDQHFITREAALKDEEIQSKITGKVLGSITTKVAQTFGLKNSEYQGKKVEEVVALGYEKINGEMAKLKESAGKGDDERVKKLTAELETKQQALEDLEKNLEAERTGRQTDVGNLTTALKQVKLQTKVKEIKSAIPFVDEYHGDEIKQAGFDAIINNNYKVDLDENDNVVVYDKAGKPVKHPTVSSKYAGLDDVLKMEAEKRGLLKKNKVPVTRTLEIQSGEGTRKVDVAKIHPKALKHEQKLNGA